MSYSTLLAAIVVYFVAVYVVSRIGGKSGGGNSSFFTGDHSSKWYLVSLGMVSASVSGISVVSVPGMVRTIGFTYMQMVFGFILGYVAIAWVLLPLYYRLRLTSIYGYLGQRFGAVSHKTGACFFILFKFVAAASKLYVVIIVLQFALFDHLGIPFAVSSLVFVLFVFGYTCRQGIKALVLTDAFQTVCMLMSLVMLLVVCFSAMKASSVEVVTQMCGREESQMFIFGDFYSRQNFFKQFLSGIFVVVVMTGLDQDVMQKNLTCPDLRSARKNMLCLSVSFVPVNLILLSIGLLLVMLAQQEDIALPVAGDQVLPFFALDYFGGPVAVFFLIAILAAAFSSVDSALVSLTTSFAVDIMEMDVEKITKRHRLMLHFLICMVFLAVMMLFRLVNNQNAIDALYSIVSYLYGPLLGMFAFGIFTRRGVRDRLVPVVAVLSPVLCYVADFVSQQYWGYKFGYELLMLNGLITFAGLWIISCGKNN